MKYNRLLLSFVCITIYASSSGQDINQQKLDSFSGKFITAIRTHEKQRVYLVTDKSVFANGESIWFKAFLLNDISQRLNAKSKYLFVDLVNEKDSVIKAVILYAENKQTDSRIILPGSIPGGYYWLRAYTRQMSENDINNICVKSIYVSDKTGDNFIKPIKNNSQESVPVVTFYPEGGSIITGVNSTVALRTSYLNGTPLIINGYIKDDHDAIIAAFTTNTDGLGKFDFEPSGYRKYKAAINWHGKEISYPLPSFNFYKGQVSVTKQAEAYKLRILLGDSIYKKDNLTYIIGVSKDSLIFASIGRGLYEIPVAEKKLPDGITTFYLFDESFNLLSERSIYVHDNNVHIKVTTDKNAYSRREKVTLNVSITDANQHPIPSLIALSVTDTLGSDPREQCGPYPSKYDLKSIDNMFLARNECFTDNDIDLLMLARENDYQMLSKTLHQTTAVDTDSLLYIKGTVLNERNKPSVNKIITILSNSSDFILHSDTTDNAGRFHFPFDNYADSTQFALEVRNLNGNTQNDKVVLDSFAYPKIKTPVALKQFLQLSSKTLKTYLNNYYNNEFIVDGKHTLAAVIVNDKNKPVNYDQSKRVSPNSAILTSDDLNERSSVGNAILKVGGVHLLNGYLVINGLTAMKAPDPSSEPVLLVDGTEVAKTSDVGDVSPVMSYLNSLNPKHIDFIEILKGAEGANYGVRGGNGVILVNMLHKQRDPNPGGSNVKTFYAKGISNAVLFPIPDYQKKEVTISGYNNSTLFWNGNFVCDNLNTETFSFFTDDISATYKVTITGITIHGDIIYKTLSFQSK